MADDLPDRSTVLALDPHQLPAYFDSLARPSQYNLASKNARAHVKLALYNWALSGDQSTRAAFFPSRTGIDLPTDHDDTANHLDSLGDKWTLAAAQASQSGNAAGDEYSPSRRGKPCGHVFRPGESVYRCRDCGVDPTCVLCSRCFHASGHTENGHDVTTSVHSGVGAGCCDCGDVEAWKPGCQRDCKYHGDESRIEQDHHHHDDGTVTSRSDKGKGRAGDQDLDGRIEAVTARVRETLALDWALDVLERAPATLELPTRVEEITGIAPDSPPAPEADEDLTGPGGVFSGLATLGPDQDQIGGAAESRGNLSAASVARLLREAATLHGGGGGGNDAAGEGQQPVVLTDETGQVLDPADAQLPPALRDLLRTLDTATAEGGEEAAIPLEWLNVPGAYPTSVDAATASSPPPLTTATGPLPPPTEGPYATVLWNDERHSFDQVIHQVRRAAQCSVKAASDIAVLVDRQGRAIVRVSDSAADCLAVAKTIAQIGLATTVRTALETWREQVAVEICTAFVQDLLRVEVAGEIGGLGETVARVWLERGPHGEKSRFQRWARVDERLWKMARKTGQEVAVGLVNVGTEVRAELSKHFSGSKAVPGEGS